MIQMLVALALQSAATPPAPDACQVDRSALLALGQDAFDQDMNGGWRPLSQRPGCESAAADLIRDYRVATEGRLHVLYWHEGQLRANAGQYPEAIRLMELSRTASDSWNVFGEATIAFLRGDRAALEAARARLASLPRPPGFREEVLANGVHVTWPPNLAVVDGLIHCFGRPYREAATLQCRVSEAPQRTSR
jgi:hypothetical protein